MLKARFKKAAQRARVLSNDAADNSTATADSSKSWFRSKKAQSEDQPQLVKVASAASAAAADAPAPTPAAAAADAQDDAPTSERRLRVATTESRVPEDSSDCGELELDASAHARDLAALAADGASDDSESPTLPSRGLLPTTPSSVPSSPHETWRTVQLSLEPSTTPPPPPSRELVAPASPASDVAAPPTPVPTSPASPARSIPSPSRGLTPAERFALWRIFTNTIRRESPGELSILKCRSWMDLLRRSGLSRRLTDAHLSIIYKHEASRTESGAFTWSAFGYGLRSIGELMYNRSATAEAAVPLRAPPLVRLARELLLPANPRLSEAPPSLAAELEQCGPVLRTCAASLSAVFAEYAGPPTAAERAHSR